MLKLTDVTCHYVVTLTVQNDTFVTCGRVNAPTFYNILSFERC